MTITTASAEPAAWVAVVQTPAAPAQRKLREEAADWSESGRLQADIAKHLAAGTTPPAGHPLSNVHRSSLPYDQERGAVTHWEQVLTEMERLKGTISEFVRMYRDGATRERAKAAQIRAAAAATMDAYTTHFAMTRPDAAALGVRAQPEDGRTQVVPVEYHPSAT